MSFDARSLERLQQLGRSLPQPLPQPPSKADSSPAPTVDGHLYFKTANPVVTVLDTFRPGAADDLLAAALERHGHHAWVRSRAQAIDEGWFGPVVSPPVAGRLGDVAMVPFEPIFEFDDVQPTRQDDWFLAAIARCRRQLRELEGRTAYETDVEERALAPPEHSVFDLPEESDPSPVAQTAASSSRVPASHSPFAVPPSVSVTAAAPSAPPTFPAASLCVQGAPPVTAPTPLPVGLILPAPAVRAPTAAPAEARGRCRRRRSPPNRQRDSDRSWQY